MQLSPNFDESEFACHHCQSTGPGIDGELVQLLEAVRERFGQPITIMSGYRCPEHNKAVGGAKSSQHMLGTAADIKIPGQSPKEVARVVELLMPNKGGIGVYPSFTHVDTRRNRARW